MSEGLAAEGWSSSYSRVSSSKESRRDVDISTYSCHSRISICIRGRVIPWSTDLYTTRFWKRKLRSSLSRLENRILARCSQHVRTSVHFSHHLSSPFFRFPSSPRTGQESGWSHISPTQSHQIAVRSTNLALTLWSANELVHYHNQVCIYLTALSRRLLRSLEIILPSMTKQVNDLNYDDDQYVTRPRGTTRRTREIQHPSDWTISNEHTFEIR